MKQIWIHLIVRLVRGLIDGGLFEQLQQLVQAATAWDIPGEERRKRVLAELAAMGGMLGAAVADTAPWLLNLALEALVARQKIASGS